MLASVQVISILLSYISYCYTQSLISFYFIILYKYTAVYTRNMYVAILTWTFQVCFIAVPSGKVITKALWKSFTSSAAKWRIIIIIIYFWICDQRISMIEYWWTKSQLPTHNSSCKIIKAIIAHNSPSMIFINFKDSFCDISSTAESDIYISCNIMYIINLVFRYSCLNICIAMSLKLW